ncbi:hypothetical protein CC80DRAFT_593040 [Byssothecium circinans]|uniref:Uncharacterized protein n=1 Tax=Byssothecium circinans TaxID=147558 RepID=A0A6A5U7C6_9PLEO|nr:hypothetical protein CC80DRAFT_593040 [Byssothecium circinans]
MAELEPHFASLTLAHDGNDALHCNMPSDQLSIVPMTDSAVDRASSDPVLDVIINFVKEEQKRNFAFLGRDTHLYTNGETLAIYRTDPEDVEDSCKRWSLNVKDVDGVWYSFRLVFHKLVHTVPLRCRTAPASPLAQQTEGLPDLLNGIAQLEVMTVEEDMKLWMDLRAWMRKTFEWHDPFEATLLGYQHEEMDFWWRGNGKYFRLLKLPLELREMIYLAAIGHIIIPKAEKIITFGTGYSYGEKGRPGLTRDPNIERPNLNLLLVSRQIKQEVNGAVWMQAYKRFRATTRIELPHHAFRRYKELAPPRALNRLQLEMSAACYFDFICYSMEPGPVVSTPPDGLRVRALHGIPSLRYLDFRFMSPKHPDAVCPWSYENLRIRSTGIGSEIAHSCQETWIDWFFTLAFDQLPKLRVSMSGCIKDSTRAKWEPRFKYLDSKQGKNEIVDNQTAMVHRLVRHLKTELVKHDDKPLPCYCSISCCKGNNFLAALNRGDRRGIVGLEEAIEEQYWSFSD